MKSIQRILTVVVSLLTLTFLYLEFLHYYVVILNCSWPKLRAGCAGGNGNAAAQQPEHWAILGDTHLLGWRLGHWFDRLRREWQMERSFQTMLTLLSPSAVFILGDVFDEGKWCPDDEYTAHFGRFQRMFRHDPQTVRLYTLAGNHDIGFHYATSRYLYAIGAQKRLANVSAVLDECRSEGFCPPPILMQHYPMYRQSESVCEGKLDPDGAPPSEHNQPYRTRLEMAVEQPYFSLLRKSSYQLDSKAQVKALSRSNVWWDCISAEASQQLVDGLRPRLILTAHSHHYCRRRLHYSGHEPVDELTVPSFSWRYKTQPSFFLLTLSADCYEISRCYLPNENTVYFGYTVSILAIVIYMLFELTLLFLRPVGRVKQA